MIKLFLYLHIAGLLLLSVGIVGLLYSDQGGKSVELMTGIASAIGLGLLMISPYPVIKVIQCMKKMQADSD